MKFSLTLDTFIISDSHFGHQDVLVKEPLRQLFARKHGFQDFDAYSVNMWNAQVNRDDFVLHLGDLYFNRGWKYLLELEGTKKLLVGNNDLKKYKRLQDFTDWSVCKKIKLKIKDKKKILKKIGDKWGKDIFKDKLLNAIVIDMAGERIMFSHFPVMDRKKNDRYACTREVLDSLYKICDCSLNIHGHTHSRNTKNSFCLNVSAEKTNFMPIKIRDVMAMRSF
ncbi:metallophosphoesterase [Helicobacter sp. 11S03491-1]|uniref:metallophosphoesterase n=1 Tax=Helicobacter sp. 11S03491-1 TaxID=1476196 RepID=UPI000BA50A78|nr:metallophosphoesterase [Helicobacter sp. 11S03491-1]PAF43321.1 hypothetical protein BKH45_01390 [Helicobacter sp. 11S03491-1]